MRAMRARGDAGRPRPAARRCCAAGALAPGATMVASAALRAGDARCSRDWAAFLDGARRSCPTTTGPTPRGRSARSPASGSARSTGGWSRWGGRSTSEPARGLPRAAQEGQGAALPARAVRRAAVPARRRQADDQVAEGAAGRARPPPGPRGPGRDAALRSRDEVAAAAGRRRRADGDGRAGRAARRGRAGGPRRVRRARSRRSRPRPSASSSRTRSR